MLIRIFWSGEGGWGGGGGGLQNPLMKVEAAKIS